MPINENFQFFLSDSPRANRMAQNFAAPQSVLGFDRRINDDVGAYESFIRGFGQESALVNAAAYGMYKVGFENFLTGRTEEEDQAMEGVIQGFQPTPGYSALEHLSSLGRIDDLEHIGMSQSYAETEMRLERLDEITSRAMDGVDQGAYAAGRLGGAIVDPSILIGAGLLKTTARGAMILGTAVTTEELVKQVTAPEFRSQTDMALAVGAGFSFGAVIGGITQSVAARTVARQAELQSGVDMAVARAADQGVVADRIAGIDTPPANAVDEAVARTEGRLPPEQRGTLSAARNIPAEAQNTPVAAFGLEKMDILSDAILLMNATVAGVRDFAEEFLELSFYLNKNYAKGGMTMVDTATMSARNRQYGALRYLRENNRNHYRAYANRHEVLLFDAKGEGASAVGNEVLDNIARARNRFMGRKEPENFMNEYSFGERVGEYMSRRRMGQVIPEDDIRFPPEVRASADTENVIRRQFREELIDVDGFTYARRRNLASFEKNMKRQREFMKQLKKEMDEAPIGSKTYNERAKAIRTMEDKIEAMVETRKGLLKEIESIRKNPPNPEWHNPVVGRHAVMKARNSEFEQLLMKHAKILDEEKGVFVKPTIDEVKGYIQIQLEKQVTDRLGSHFKSIKGTLKPRRWQIPTHEMPDFYITNAHDLGEMYVRGVSPDIELLRRFETLDLDEVMAPMRVEYDDQIAKVAKSNPEEAKRLVAERDRVETALDAIWRQHRGVYGLPANPDSKWSATLRIAKNFNASTLLSGLTAQLPDIGNMILRHSLNKVMGSAIKAYDRGLMDTLKLGKLDAQRAYEALDMILSGRVGTMSGTDFIQAMSTIERMSQQLADTGFNLALWINPWNQVAKSFAAITASSIMHDQMMAARTIMMVGKRMKRLKSPKSIANALDEIRDAERVLGEHGLARLRANGIDPDNEALMNLMHDMYQKHGIIDGELRIANIDEWGKDVFEELEQIRLTLDDAKFRADNDVDEVLRARAEQEIKSLQQAYDTLAEQAENIEEAQNIMTLAMGKELRNTVVTPTIGDANRFLSTEYGSVIFQFKRFAFSATSRVLISGLQQRDGYMLSGVASLVATGMLVDHLRTITTGGPEKSAADRLVSGIDRSGVLGVFGDINNTLETLTNNSVGLRPLLGGRSNYNSSVSRKAGALFGPTAGQMFRALGIGQDYATGNVDRWTHYNTLRFIPYWNATQWRALTTMADDISTPVENTPGLMNNPFSDSNR